MTVKKIFRENPYLTNLFAQVTNVNQNIITLDQTIAYAFSWWQESDSWTISGYEIIKAEKIWKEIFYTISSDHTLKKWDCVEIKIGRDKRYKLMKLHFAAEIILELINQNYKHPQKIWAHISSEKARLDFVRHGDISDIFKDLQTKFQTIVDSNLKITSAFSDEVEEIRYREIKWFAKVNCWWTHIRNTGEIWLILLKRVHLGSDKERIEIRLV